MAEAVVAILLLVALIGVPLAVGVRSTRRRWPIATGVAIGGLLGISQALVGEELSLLAVPIFIAGLFGGGLGALAGQRNRPA